MANLCGADACEAGGGGEPVEVEELDVSQSYWTYWHWFDQVTGYFYGDEISTGGNTWKSHAIIRDRGLMNEIDFVPEGIKEKVGDAFDHAAAVLDPGREIECPTMSEQVDFEIGEGIRYLPLVHPAAAARPPVHPHSGEPPSLARLTPEEGVARPLLPPDDGFQQEAERRTGQPRVRGHRSPRVEEQ